MAERDLRNAGAAGLDDDWRFSIAYNAVLQAANAALLASGHTVPKGDSHHFRVLGALVFTLGMDTKRVEKLDRFRKRRSMSIYDVAGVITSTEAKDIQEMARDLLGDVRKWLKKSHPELLKKTS